MPRGFFAGSLTEPRGGVDVHGDMIGSKAQERQWKRHPANRHRLDDSPWIDACPSGVVFRPPRDILFSNVLVPTIFGDVLVRKVSRDLTQITQGQWPVE